MVKMTPRRKRRMNRRANGTFGPWTGGKSKRQLKKKSNNFQGIAIHIGKEYKRQKGRVAKPGAIVRKKKLDGSFHKGAFWYIRTPHGWRKSPTQTRKPGKSTIRLVTKRARPGR